MPAHREQDSGTRLTLLLETRGGGGSVQHAGGGIGERGAANHLAQLRLGCVAQRVVQEAGFGPGLRLAGRQRHLRGPPVEQRRDTGDVRAALLADLRPRGELQRGGFHQAMLVMRCARSLRLVTTSRNPLIAPSRPRSASAWSTALDVTSSAPMRLRPAISDTRATRSSSTVNSFCCSLDVTAMRCALWALCAVDCTICSRAPREDSESCSTSDTSACPLDICCATLRICASKRSRISPASSLARRLSSASARTSSATTANPRPSTLARAASIAAFSASRLVWSAICEMIAMKSVMRRVLLASASICPALSPTNFFAATSRSIAVPIFSRFVTAMSVALRLAPAASRASLTTRPVASRSACVISRLDRTCSPSSEIPRVIPPPQRARRLGQRLELARDARDGVEQRIPEVVDVQRRRQLVGEAAHEHCFLRAVGVRLVMLQLEHAHDAIAEAQTNRDGRAHVGFGAVHSCVSCGVEHDDGFGVVDRERAQGGAIGIRRRGKRQESLAPAVDHEFAVAFRARDAQ